MWVVPKASLAVRSGVRWLVVVKPAMLILAGVRVGALGKSCPKQTWVRRNPHLPYGEFSNTLAHHEN